MPDLLETLAGTAIDAARRAGADYADVRAGRQSYEALATYDEKIDAISAGEGQGIGLRILKDGQWGFAGSDTLNESAAAALAAPAMTAARAAKAAGGPPSR